MLNYRENQLFCLLIRIEIPMCFSASRVQLDLFRLFIVRIDKLGHGPLDIHVLFFLRVLLVVLVINDPRSLIRRWSPLAPASYVGFSLALAECDNSSSVGHVCSFIIVSGSLVLVRSSAPLVGTESVEGAASASMSCRCDLCVETDGAAVICRQHHDALTTYRFHLVIAIAREVYQSVRTEMTTSYSPSHSQSTHF